MKSLNFSMMFVVPALMLSISSCKEEEFYEKEIVTLADKYELDKQQIEDIKLRCDEARAQNQVLTKTVTIDFPAAIECAFNEEGSTADDLNEFMNGPRINARIMARARQDVSFQAELNETICDLEFNFPEQTMQYDDEIFLLLNDYVIISSQDYSQSSAHPNGFLTNDFGLQEYKWYGQNALYNLLYSWDYTPKYCLGVDINDPDFDEKCAIPSTETVGQIKLDIPDKEIIKISVLSANPDPEVEKEFNFSFITTGDNDNGDCEHAAYSFEVDVSYILD